jgi:DNA-binding GntR family transcriptional regulator
VEVAEAIAAGDGPGAREASARIMRRTISELEPAWTEQPRVFIPVPRG